MHAELYRSTKILRQVHASGHLHLPNPNIYEVPQTLPNPLNPYCFLIPKPYTPSPRRQTLNQQVPKPMTLYPKPQFLDAAPKPSNLNDKR
jgi:hypothetical protein